MNENISRGQIYLADLEPTIGSEQGGARPVLILQNDIGNRHSPTTIIAAITSRIYTKRLSTFSIYGIYSSTIIFIFPPIQLLIS